MKKAGAAVANLLRFDILINTISHLDIIKFFTRHEARLRGRGDPNLVLNFLRATRRAPRSWGSPMPNNKSILENDKLFRKIFITN